MGRVASSPLLSTLSDSPQGDIPVVLQLMMIHREQQVAGEIGGDGGSEGIDDVAEVVGTSSL